MQGRHSRLGPVTSSLARNNGETYRISVVEDISERKRREDDLREREARLQSILDTAPEALITIDERGTVGSFSRSAETVVRIPAEEVIGRNISMLMPSPYREEHDGYLERYQRTGERRIIGIGRVVSAQRKDGTVFPMELAVGEVNVAGQRSSRASSGTSQPAERSSRNYARPRRWKPSGSSPAASRTTSTTCSRSSSAISKCCETRINDARQLELLKEARETAEHGAQLTERLLAFGRRQPLQPRLTDVSQSHREVTPDPPAHAGRDRQGQGQIGHRSLEGPGRPKPVAETPFSTWPSMPATRCPAEEN